jgi:hypothetical protein
MEAICFSETLGSVRTTRRYGPEDSILQGHYRENLEFNKFMPHTYREYTGVYMYTLSISIKSEQLIKLFLQGKTRDNNRKITKLEKRKEKSEAHKWEEKVLNFTFIKNGRQISSIILETVTTFPTAPS